MKPDSLKKGWFPKIITKLGVVGEGENRTKNLLMVVASLLDQPHIAVQLDRARRDLLKSLVATLRPESPDLYLEGEENLREALTALVEARKKTGRVIRDTIVVGVPSSLRDLVEVKKGTPPMTAEEFLDLMGKRLEALAEDPAELVDWIKRHGPKYVLWLVFRDEQMADLLLRLPRTASTMIVGKLREWWGEGLDEETEREFRELRTAIKKTPPWAIRRPKEVWVAAPRAPREIRMELMDRRVVRHFFEASNPLPEELSGPEKFAFFLSRHLPQLDRGGTLTVILRVATGSAFFNFVNALRDELEPAHLGVFSEKRTLVLQWPSRNSQARLFLDLREGEPSVRIPFLNFRFEPLGHCTSRVLLGKLEDELNLTESIIERMREDHPDRLWQTVWMLMGRIEKTISEVVDRDSGLFEGIGGWYEEFRKFICLIGRKNIAPEEARLSLERFKKELAALG